MAEAVAGQRLRLGDAGLLRQARQRVVLAEDGDDRPAFAGLAHHRGRDAGDVLGDAEALRSSIAVCSAQELNSP